LNPPLVLVAFPSDFIMHDKTRGNGGFKKNEKNILGENGVKTGKKSKNRRRR